MKWCHERRGLGAVEGFEDAGLGEVDVVEGEVAGLGRREGGEDGFAAAVVEEDFVAEEDVAGADALGEAISLMKRSVDDKATKRSGGAAEFEGGVGH